MITRRQYERIRRDSGKELQIGDPILLSMYQNGGFKIREVPLKGVFSYARGNPQLDEMVLTDIQTIRVLNGLSPGLEEHQTIFEDDADLLNDSLDALFLENDSMQSLQQESVSADDVFNIVDSTDPSVWKGGGQLPLPSGPPEKRGFPEDRHGPAGLAVFHTTDWKPSFWTGGRPAGFSARLVSLLQIFFKRRIYTGGPCRGYRPGQYPSHLRIRPDRRGRHAPGHRGPQGVRPPPILIGKPYPGGPGGPRGDYPGIPVSKRDQRPSAAFI